MAVGKRSSIYYDDELAAALEVEQERGLTASELLRQRLGLSPWDGRTPLREDTTGVIRRPVRAARRSRARGSGLRVVAPLAPLPVDGNAGTPLATFRPPPDAYVPPEVLGNDGEPEG